MRTAVQKKTTVISVIVSIMMLFTAFAVPADAASFYDVAGTINECAPIVTYATPSSGASKVHAYSDSTLKTKQTSYYILAYSDQIVIRQMSSDRKAVKVTYPSTSSSTGYRTKWFATNDILGKNFERTGTIFKGGSSSMTTYRMISSTKVQSYGSIYPEDESMQFNDIMVGSNVYTRVMYPISSKTVNKVSGCKYKMALLPFMC